MKRNPSEIVVHRINSVSRWKDKNKELALSSLGKLGTAKDIHSNPAPLAFSARLFSVYFSSLGYSSVEKEPHIAWKYVTFSSFLLCYSLELILTRSAALFEGAVEIESVDLYLSPYYRDLSFVSLFGFYWNTEWSGVSRKSLKLLVDYAREVNCPSMASFADWLLSGRVNFKKRRNDIYARVAQNGFDLASEEDVKALCDYHCFRMNSVSSDLNDFDVSPFDLIPYEILVILKKSGCIRISHPLLDHPLAQPKMDLDLSVPEIERVFMMLEDRVPNGLRPTDFFNARLELHA